jgi:hypothetical protein
MDRACWRLKERNGDRWLYQLIGAAEETMLSGDASKALRFANEQAAMHAVNRLHEGKLHLDLEAVSGPIRMPC